MKIDKNPKLSIIIPYYYQLEIIKYTLDVISKQTQKIKANIEILIVDSNTNSEKINIQKYINQNNFLQIILIQTKNCVSAKRNQGILRSSCDNLVFLDDDVIPCEGFVEYFLKIKCLIK